MDCMCVNVCVCVCVVLTSMLLNVVIASNRCNAGVEQKGGGADKAAYAVRQACSEVCPEVVRETVNCLPLHTRCRERTEEETKKETQLLPKVKQQEILQPGQQRLSRKVQGKFTRDSHERE